MEWFEKATVYHIYPLGYCGCEKENDYAKQPVNRLGKIADNIPEIKNLGMNTVYFGPVFESVRHGYDTVDYMNIDRRLGTNEDFSALCAQLHENGIRVVLDGVFNHVGRDFWAFRDVRENKWNSRYKDWFIIRDGNSNYNDGFYYEGWEGHFELVKLNLYNSEVREYLKSCITKWKELFDIDGIRLDVAYCLDLNFLKELRGHCKWLKSDFWLLGETLHGDYNKWMNAEMLDSVTNYECYKGLYSSFNEFNMFEIAYSLNRQFGSENWCLYRGKHLYCFVDNHDVSRIASQLKEPRHLPLIYTLLFTMNGIPAVYYGSEYGFSGEKNQGDDVLRPEFHKENCDTQCELYKLIAELAAFHSQSNALCGGSYRQLQLTNRQFAFMREYENEKVVTLLNIDANPFTFNIGMSGTMTDIISGKQINTEGGIELMPFSSMVLKN